MTQLNVSIIGLGLIGGSLGLALGTADPKEAPLGRANIIGYDLDPRVTRAAKARLVIDVAVDSIADAARMGDIIIIATPVLAVREVMAQIAPHVRHGALVTDTASTKAQIVRWARELLPTTVSFVGGHPMAGAEQAGVEAANLDLFRGSVYCLCFDPHTRAEAVDTAFALAETVGAKPYAIDPAEHDTYVAGISHLPFLLSVALTELASRSPGWVEMRPLASSGFRDTSRLASGDPTMHRDICLSNTAALTHWLDEAGAVLAELRQAIAAQDGPALERVFAHAQQKRDEWLRSSPNVRPGEGTPLPKEDLQPLSLRSILLGRRRRRR
jgi:prephenate dehydrogenase